MKFGKTDLKPEEIDFNIPNINAEKEIQVDPKELMIYTGQPVWSAKGNIGKIYPKGTKAGDFLYHYSRQFNSIELNATYYKIPSPDQVQKWKSQCPENFKFCPKFPQFISHRKNLSQKTEALDEFLRNIYQFEENLGITFLQLPPHLSPKDSRELKKFLDMLPEDMEFAVEFRHEDWFRQKDQWESILDFIRNKKIATVISDTPGRRDVLHMSLSGESVIIRFKGFNLHPSDFNRIEMWVNSCIEMCTHGISTIYFFLHQEDESLGIELAQKLLSELNSRLNTKFKGPEILNNQASLF